MNITSGRSGSNKEKRPSSRDLKTIQKLRLALAVIGGVGCVLWLIVGVVILLFGGFKPGGPVGGLSGAAWISCFTVVFASFIHYMLAGLRPWTRSLLWAGIIIHVFWFIAVVTIITQTDGGVVFIPFFLGGALCWMAYALTQTSPQRTGTFPNGEYYP